MEPSITSSSISILTIPNSAGSIGMIGILILIVMLVLKELASASTDHRWQQLSRLLNIAILPLMIGFILIVIFRVIDALN